jgi:CelD/BcsL family acetyltransferase involved in cellulose biosynthesis
VETVWGEWEKSRRSTPFLLVAHCSDEIIGWWPLVLSKRTIGYRLQNLGQELSDYAFPYVSMARDRYRGEIAARMLRETIESRSRFSFLQFPGFLYAPHPFESHSTKELAEWIEGISPGGWKIGPPGDNAVVDLRPYRGNPGGFLQERLSTRFRKNVQSSERMLKRAGTIGFETALSSGEMEELRPLYFSWYRYGSSNEQKTTMKLKIWWQYYKRVHDSLLHTSVLTLNNEPVSLTFGFNRGGQYDYFSPVFNPGCEQSSPGKVHLMYLLQDLMEKGYSLFNFLAGDEPYKQHWATWTYRSWHVRWYHTGNLAAILHRLKR